MEYINIVTKAVITTNGEIGGDNWVKVDEYTEAATEEAATEETPEKPVKKTAKKPAKEKNDAE